MIDHGSLFYYEGDSLDAAAAQWDMSGPFPLPRWDMRCPQCGGLHSERQIQGRRWVFHNGPGDRRSKNKWRCDVEFKCRRCSYLFSFGVVVPPEMLAHHVERLEYRWREVHAILFKGESTSQSPLYAGKLAEIIKKVR